MPQKNISMLKSQLHKLGFSGTLDQVDAYSKTIADKFNACMFAIEGNDRLMYTLDFKKNNKEWSLEGYTLKKTSIDIPKVIVGGINIEKLERKFENADKIYNSYYSEVPQKNHLKFFKKLEADLTKLFSSGKKGEEIASLLTVKYLPENDYNKYLRKGNELRAKFELSLRIDSDNGRLISAKESYEKLKQITEVKKEYLMADEVLALATIALSKGEHYLAYNNSLYFIDKDDVHFFKTHGEATEFAENNISDHDRFSVLHFISIKDILTQISYGELVTQHQNPDPDANGLYNKDGNAFTDTLIDHFESQQLSFFDKQLKTNVMNNDNLQYLKDNIKYMGFGENMNRELERNLGEGKVEFQLQFAAEINKKPFEATLNFRKSNFTEMYFFNSYHASLEKSNGEKNEQTFYLNKGKGVTAKEAYNLLDGRTVHKDLTTKEGQPYKAWIQLDFENKDKNNNFEVKQFHENYGYDLKAAVEKFAVAELKDPEKKKALLQSLQKGNVQSVTIEKDGNSHKMFMEADPQYKKVTLYDDNMKMVAKESLEQYKAGIDKGAKEVKQGQENDKKKELKKEVKPEKKNGQSLLPKKRESKGKGLGVS